MARQESKLALRTCSESLPGITKECSSDMTLSRAAQRAVGKEGRVNADFFSAVGGPIPFGGLDSSDPLTYKVYEADRLVLGKRMEDLLRIAVCLWHSFNWPGSDVFGVGTFDRPWLSAGIDAATAARSKIGRASCRERV